MYLYAKRWRQRRTTMATREQGRNRNQWEFSAAVIADYFRWTLRTRRIPFLRVYRAQPQRGSWPPKKRETRLRTKPYRSNASHENQGRFSAPPASTHCIICIDRSSHKVSYSTVAALCVIASVAAPYPKASLVQLPLKQEESPFPSCPWSMVSYSSCVDTVGGASIVVLYCLCSVCSASPLRRPFLS